MELEEFEKYWEVSRDELAYICCCSRTTVDHWYSQQKTRRIPKDEHKRLLALAHHIWTALETEPAYLQKLREMYHQKQTRRKSRPL
ncbi:conserved hypothetical protein [Gloeothece citriformis PCC 7424]|uniref:Uncharacterized protein n=1 Tax=Gloeothece citriformis (strain PCC 7424) TaxID=65393 RepID=B7KDK7_GLOC7|nr:hypothetical protein [Gloeothece citriformis]ACK70309.1 conserved hypothetical protein [Gloeothece citriformis PCC 7424]